MPTIAEIRHSSEELENDENRMRKFAKSMLKGSLFVGMFQEKRFVEPLNAYRDVIKIADDETQLIENLITVKKRCRKFFLQKMWIGFTEPHTIGAPAGYNLWVSMAQPTFGSFWYKIKTVEFHDSEMCMRLEVMRPYRKESTPIRSSSTLSSDDSSCLDGPGIVSDASTYLREQARFFFTNILTLPNMKEAVIFTFLLISTVLTVSVHIVKYLLEYFLKLLHESSGFVKACNPAIVAFTRVIMQAINGFYTLIAIMWTTRKPTKQQNQYQNELLYGAQYNNYVNNRALPDPRFVNNEQIQWNSNQVVRPRSSVKITALYDD